MILTRAIFLKLEKRRKYRKARGLKILMEERKIH